VTKQRIYLLPLLIISSTIFNPAKSQPYSIESFDGGNAKINLNYTLFSKTLKVSCLKDTLFLVDYTGTSEVRVLNKRFLQIVYWVRAGSDMWLKNTVILLVKKSKIIVAILVTSYSEYVSPDQEGIYEFKFIMIGVDIGSYKLMIKARDEQKSKLHPRGNYNKNWQDTLSFDPSQDIFYSSYQDISNSFTVYDSKTYQTSKQDVKGTLPVINLGENEYYYIKGEWYEKNAIDKLVKNSYRR
jgi:hypothetical protein